MSGNSIAKQDFKNNIGVIDRRPNFIFAENFICGKITIRTRIGKKQKAKKEKEEKERDK